MYTYKASAWGLWLCCRCQYELNLDKKLQALTTEPKTKSSDWSECTHLMGNQFFHRRIKLELWTSWLDLVQGVWDNSYHPWSLRLKFDKDLAWHHTRTKICHHLFIHFLFPAFSLSCAWVCAASAHKLKTRSHWKILHENACCQPALFSQCASPCAVL